MGKGAVKHEAKILNDIQLLLNQQNGIISQLQIIQIIQKYYSEGYAESMGFKKIEREITRRNMVKKIKVNVGNISQQIGKASSINQLLSLYISPTVPDDSKRSLISTFIRNSIPSLEIPAMKRSISKELFFDPNKYNQKRPEIMEFPSIQFRSMLLHQFLISTFKTNPFSLELISKLIPVHLSAQIIRAYDTKPIILSLISPLKRSYQFEIDILIPYLRPPFHLLVRKIDATHNSIMPTAVLEIPKFDIYKRFDFINDPSAISDYWNYIFSLQSEKLLQFPLIISTRFSKFFTIYFEKLSIREVPFFPYQIEKFSEKVGVSPSVTSYSIQKIFKHKLKILQCSKESYLESKLFPISGFLPFLFTKASIFKAPEPKFAESLSTPFKVDGSLNCLAKIYAASQLTEEGYIINRRSNFKLFKKQVKKWISKCSRFRNLFESLKEDDSFRSLIKFEMALLIEEMKFPFFYYNRIGLNPIKTIPLEIQPEDENGNQNSNNNNDDDDNGNENELVGDDDQNEQKSILRSNSANFNAESFKQVNRILHSPSLNLFKGSTSRPALSNLNEIFTKSFPDFTKEEFFNHNQTQNRKNENDGNNNNNENEGRYNESGNEEDNDEGDGILPYHNLYFQDNDTSFPTAYAIDSPLNSDMSNDEVVEPLSIFSPFESSQRNRIEQNGISIGDDASVNGEVNEDENSMSNSNENASEISNYLENEDGGSSSFFENEDGISNNDPNASENGSFDENEISNNNNDDNENSGFYEDGSSKNKDDDDVSENGSFNENEEGDSISFNENDNEINNNNNDDDASSIFNEDQNENRNIDDDDGASNGNYNEDNSSINEEENSFVQNNENDGFIENQSVNAHNNESENGNSFYTANTDFNSNESSSYNRNLNENESRVYNRDDECDNSNSSFDRNDGLNENSAFASNDGHFGSIGFNRNSIFGSDESENNGFNEQQNEETEEEDDEEEECNDDDGDDGGIENEENFSSGDNRNFNFNFNNANMNDGYEDDDDDGENGIEDDEDGGFIEHHFLPNFDEDYEYDDEIVEYPVLDPSDFFEATETEFLSLFQMKKRIIDVSISVSVAVEFLKIVLAAPSTAKTNDLKLRQTVHFSQKDAIDAIWLLNSIDVYKHKQKMRLPENDWELPLPENSFPRPLFMAYCDNSEKNDPVPLKILWSKTAETEFTEEGENESIEDDDDDDDVIDGDDEFDDDDNKSGEYITFRFKNVTFREQISAFKKERQTFKFERQRLDLPNLPDFDTSCLFKYNPDQIYDQLYNSDPLGQFCFGQYDTEFPSIEDFPCRVIMNLVNSSGVFGASLTDIVNIFGFSPLNSDNVISKVNFLCTLNFITRVPSSRLVPRYSRFIPCNMLCKPVNGKIELVSPHIWSNFDGFINKEVQMNLMKNISTFVFAHEFCDFLLILEEFPYVSPYDLCLLLQVLECEEIIFSQYFKKIKSSLFEDEINIPIPPFDTFEKFLIILDYQRINDEDDISFHRIIRTNRSMLPNLCMINNY